MTLEQKEKIRQLKDQGYGYKKISQITGISVTTIASFIKRNESVVYCKNCGKRIENKPGFKPKTFCCDKCRNKWWNAHLDQVNRKAFYISTCLFCGKEFRTYGRANRHYCCHSCYIKHRFKERTNDTN